MPSYKKKPAFFDTEEGIEVAKALESMAVDVKFNTQNSYSANTALYPDSQISFVNKHMNYLRTYPSVDPHKYLANLRLMTRIR